MMWLPDAHSWKMNGPVPTVGAVFHFAAQVAGQVEKMAAVVEERPAARERLRRGERLCSLAFEPAIRRIISRHRLAGEIVGAGVAHVLLNLRRDIGQTRETRWRASRYSLTGAGAKQNGSNARRP